MTGKARLFVALDLPGEVRGALAAWCPALDELRPVGAESLHVTLCFLGSRPSDDSEVIGDLVATEVAGASPIVLSLGAALGLPPRRPGVLAVRLDDSGAALAALQRRLAAALCEHGLYEPEARAFLPHVTVARVRRGRCLRRDFLPAPPPPMTFSGGPVALYRSDPHPGGSRYETLERWRSSTLVGGW